MVIKTWAIDELLTSTDLNKSISMSYFQGALSSVLNYSGITIATTTTLIVAINTDRTSVLIRNNGSQTIYIGDSSVTTTNGYKLNAGQSIYIKGTTAAIYGIVVATTCDLRYLEVE